MRRIFLTAGSSIGAKLIATLAPLITIPLAVQYLGEIRYGLWMTITSLLTLFAFSDLGLGNGITTLISKHSGRDDLKRITHLISSGFVLLCGMALLLALLLLSTFHVIPWPKIMGVGSPELFDECRTVLLVALLCFLVGLPISLVVRVQNGLQEGFQSNLWQCAASFLSLGAILLAVKMQVSLPVLVFGAMVGVPVVGLLNGLYFFGKQKPGLRPRLGHFQWPIARDLLKTGSMYFILSILLAVGLASDNLILSHILGQEAVTTYSIPWKVATLLSSVAMMIYTPLWSASGEALARGDVEWVYRNTFKMVRLTTALTAAGALLFVMFGKQVICLWIGPGIAAPMALLAGMAAYACLISFSGPLFMVLNGANAVSEQIKMFLVFIPLSLVAKIIMTKQFGVSGVIWGTVLCYAIIIIPAVLWTTHHRLKRLMKTAAQN